MTFREFLTKRELVNKNGFRLLPVPGKFSDKCTIGYRYISPNNDSIYLTVEEAFFGVVKNNPKDWSDKDKGLTKFCNHKPNYLVYLHCEYGCGPWPYVAVEADSEEEAVGQAADSDVKSDCIPLNTPERERIVFDPKDWTQIKMPSKGPAMISRKNIIVRKVADVKKIHCYSETYLDRIRNFENNDDEDEAEY